MHFILRLNNYAVGVMIKIVIIQFLTYFQIKIPITRINYGSVMSNVPDMQLNKRPREEIVSLCPQSCIETGTFRICFVGS